jgi:hypothetical protein
MTGRKSDTSMPADARVAWRAAKQHGAIDRAQLHAGGLTKGGIEHRVAAGWLHRVHQGVYAVGHPGLTQRGRWTAAVLAGGEAAVLSHRSAAALWGFARDGDRPSITVPGANRHATAGIEVHASRIRAGDTVIVDGIRVTKIARTFLDLAETLTLEQLVAAIDQATGNRQIRPDLMSSMMNESLGRRGLKPLKQALLITRPQDVLTRSELERRALKLLKRAKIPAPEVNVRLHGKERDLLFRAQRLVVELDGRDHDAQRDPDYRRDNDLLARGYRTMRFTWRQVVNDPRWVIDDLTSVLAIASP